MTLPASSAPNLDVVVAELGRLWDGDNKELALNAALSVLKSALAQNRALAQQNAELLRKVYGRRSERINPHQLTLALEQLRQDQQAQAAELEAGEADAEVPKAPASEDAKEKKGKGKKRRGGGRQSLPDHLPRQEVRLVPEQASQPGMTKVSEERSEILEFVPAQFKVIVYVRETWSNLGGQIVTAPPPVKVIPKGIPGPGLLTQVVLSKYRDCVPLTRQCTIYRRAGVRLRRNTMVGWVAAAALLLEPLAKRIYELAMLSRVLQVDDTHLPTLDRSKARNIKRAHLWAMVGDKKYVAFRFTQDWSAKLAKVFLGNRIGWMQVDGYGGYAPMAEADDSLILLVGCWMHARRYFEKAFEQRHEV